MNHNYSFLDSDDDEPKPAKKPDEKPNEKIYYVECDYPDRHIIKAMGAVWLPDPKLWQLKNPTKAQLKIIREYHKPDNKSGAYGRIMMIYKTFKPLYKNEDIYRYEKKQGRKDREIWERRQRKASSKPRDSWRIDD